MDFSSVRHSFGNLTSIASAVCIAVLVQYGFINSSLADSDAASRRPHVINISTEEYPPYTSAHLKKLGIDSHIVSEAFRLEGIEAKFHFFPGARSYDLAKRGEMDATLPWAKRSGREKDFIYSDPVIKVDVEQIFFHKGQKPAWNSSRQDYQALAGTRFAAIISYNYGEKFQSAEAGNIIQVERVRDLKIAFLMLLNNRVDMVISKERVADHTLQSEFTVAQTSRLDRVAEHEDEDRYDHLLISRKSPHAEYFANAYSKGLQKLHSSGFYDRFLADLKSGKYIKSVAAQ